MAQAHPYEAIVLDVNAPRAERLRDLGRLRSAGVWAPLLMLTARDGVDDLANMVDNAFTHGAGRVSLRTEQRNGSMELHVLDEGKGFPADFLHHAFERFSRAQKTTADGSGLGLAIVETIAEAHGWEARAANAPGGGTDVWLALTVER
jgi:signal transduction histidine kinase